MLKSDILVVTGFIPIPGHTRSAETYKVLGGKLNDLTVPVMRFLDDTVESTWMYRFVNGLPFEPTWSVADNPNKNTLFYHEVQHQKFGWLLKAVETNNWSEVIVWLDYGICHVPGVTPDVINEMLERLPPDQLQIPGCWGLDTFSLHDDWPCWRFCGGLMVVPRPLVRRFALAAMGTAMQRIVETQNVTWEVNTLARLERKNVLPIQWYAADHNETMFRNFPGAPRAYLTR